MITATTMSTTTTTIFVPPYVHVMADAATSILAIAALVVAMVSQWVCGPIRRVASSASIVIASWAVGLIRASVPYCSTVNADRPRNGHPRWLETKGDRVTDLHLWQVGPGHRAAVISVISDHPLSPAIYKRRLGGLQGLSHVTIEWRPVRSRRRRPSPLDNPAR